MRQFAEELRQHGLQVDVDRTQDGQQADLTVWHDDEVDFRYAIIARRHHKPGDMLDADRADEDAFYYRAEVQLSEGGQDYDVMGWSEEQIIHDLLEQYEKHHHFLHMLR